MSNLNNKTKDDQSESGPFDGWARFFRSGKVQDSETLIELENKLEQYLKEKPSLGLGHSDLKSLEELINALQSYKISLKRVAIIRKDTLDKRMKANSKKPEVMGYTSLGTSLGKSN